MDEQTLRKVYNAYKAGSLSPEASAQYEADIASGTISLPVGVSSLTEIPVTKVPTENPLTGTPEAVKPAQQQIEEMKEAPILPEEVWKAFQSGQLSEQASKDLFNDIYDGKWQIPYATTEEVSSSFGQDAFTTLQNIGRVYPVLDTIANAITSSYGVPVSGLAGILALPFGVENSKKTIDAVQKVLVHQPMTRGGEQLTGAAAYPFQKIAEGGKAITEPIAEAGYPGTATVIQTGIEAAPVLVGGRRAIASISEPAIAAAKTGIETAGKGIRTTLEPLGVKQKPIPKIISEIEITPEIKKTVRQGMAKAIKLTDKGKMTRSQVNQYFDKATAAVEEIVKNKENLRIIDKDGNVTSKLPSTLDEFNQAIEQTKTNIFEQYDALTKEAGGKGIQVDLTPIARELKQVFKNRVLKDRSPETIKYAQKQMKVLTGREKYTPAVAGRKKYSAIETQEWIKDANASLKEYYANPNRATKGRAYIDAFIANHMREALGKAIESATGGEYVALKKKYGNLKAIEQEVNKSALRQETKSGALVDLSNIYTNTQLIRGLFKADPASLAAGAGGKATAALLRKLNDPNRIVKNMFEDADKILGQEGPKSSLSLESTIVGTAMAQSGQEEE